LLDTGYEAFAITLGIAYPAILLIFSCIHYRCRGLQVELILLGEEVRKAAAAHGCSEEELLRQLRALSHASREMSHSGADESLFLFPNTEPGWLATVRARRSLPLD
jgi:hypothetical protein